MPRVSPSTAPVKNPAPWSLALSASARRSAFPTPLACPPSSPATANSGSAAPSRAYYMACPTISPFATATSDSPSGRFASANEATAHSGARGYGA